jgi:hypothetical protein
LRRKTDNPAHTGSSAKELIENDSSAAYGPGDCDSIFIDRCRAALMIVLPENALAYHSEITLADSSSR